VKISKNNIQTVSVRKFVNMTIPSNTSGTDTEDTDTDGSNSASDTEVDEEIMTPLMVRVTRFEFWVFCMYPEALRVRPFFSNISEDDTETQSIIERKINAFLGPNTHYRDTPEGLFFAIIHRAYCKICKRQSDSVSCSKC
jgi:hypothetical protein